MIPETFSTGPHVFQIVHWNIANSENTTSTYLMVMVMVIDSILLGF